MIASQWIALRRSNTPTVFHELEILALFGLNESFYRRNVQVQHKRIDVICDNQDGRTGKLGVCMEMCDGERIWTQILPFWCGGVTLG